MNYIGSKYSLLDFLDNSISQITGITNGVFCDLFAGTGVVGLRFKQKGFKVISNDIQYYSYALNKQLIENHKEFNFNGLLDIIPNLSIATDKKQAVCKFLDHIKPLKGFIFNNYSREGTNGKEFERQYFTEYNAQKCDAIRTQIELWKANANINENEYWFLISSLLESIDKVANTASVYGAFLKHIKKTASKEFQYNPIPLFINNQSHNVYNKNANDLVNEIYADIVYIDPPYNHRQYSSNYHILETIAKYDNPKIKGKTGLRVECNNSKYCSKQQVKQEFQDLIKNIHAKYIFVSYNNEGLLSKDELAKILSSRGEYGVILKDYRRFKADIEKNRNVGGNKTVEYLHYVKCL
ncbi:MAG: DNA adenine methylase [Christensenellaceae bacterium]|jgi:adenine-specific DNA-methyltransferase|nr:DNA adenine methylase [Christensenellaceae bacterium]